MLSNFILFVSVLTTLVNTSCAGVLKCADGDNACYAQLGNSLFPTIVEGVPQLGIEPTSVIRKDVIEITRPTVTYKFKDISLSGLKNTEIRNVNLNMKKGNLKFDIYFKKGISLKTNFFIDGKLLDQDISGEGKSEAKAEKYVITVDADLQKEVKDGKTHVNLAKYSLTLNPKGKVVYRIINLAKGDQKQFDDLIEKVNANWEKITTNMLDPMIKVLISQLMNNIGLYIKSIPL